MPFRATTDNFVAGYVKGHYFQPRTKTLFFFLRHRNCDGFSETQNQRHRNCDGFEVCDPIASVLAMVANRDVSEIDPRFPRVLFLREYCFCEITALARSLLRSLLSRKGAGCRLRDCIMREQQSRGTSSLARTPPVLQESRRVSECYHRDRH